jgi:uncharacterized RDD family membrane protein YckC
MDGLTPGDPLGDRPPAPPGQPAGGYGESRVPPGAFSPPERPQRLGADVVYADWWKRVFAAILDGLIVGGATILILAVLGVGVFADGNASTAEIIVGAVLGTLIFAVLALLYAPVLMARTNGKTLGKMALGIRVARANGKPVDFWWAVLREVVVKGIGFGIAGAITGGIANLVDWFWPLFDSENRALHDFLVDSRVIEG